MTLTQKLMFESGGKSCLFFLLSLLLCAAAPYEEASSMEDISSSLSSLQDVSKRSSSRPLWYYFNNQPEDKRALSLFAHWKPQYAFKPDFPAINTRSEIVTRGGSSHARPLGQPLRWG